MSWLQASNALLPIDKRVKINFTHVWYSRFKNRFHLSFRRVDGESASADDAAISSAMPSLLQIFSTYEQRDIGNADDVGLFYRQVPE